MLLLATDAFTLHTVPSKGNGTDAVVTVYKDASVKEVRENRELVILGSWAVYQLGVKQLPVTLHCYTKGTEKLLQVHVWLKWVFCFLFEFNSLPISLGEQPAISSSSRVIHWRCHAIVLNLQVMLCCYKVSGAIICCLKGCNTCNTLKTLWSVELPFLLVIPGSFPFTCSLYFACSASVPLPLAWLVLALAAIQMHDRLLK